MLERKKERYSILILIGILVIGTSYIFKDYLYIILVSTILALSTSALNGLLLKNIVKIGKKNKFKFLIKFKDLVSSSILSIIFLFIIFFPLIYFLFNTYQLIEPYLNLEKIKIILTMVIYKLQHLPNSLSFFQDYVNIGLEKLNLLKIDSELLKKILVYTGNIFNNINNIVMEIILILVFYFIINMNGKKIKNFIYDLLPISSKNKNLLYIEFSSTSSVVLYSIIFTMFAQGLAFGLLMTFYDYNSLYTGMMAGFLSVIPIVGAALIYLPITIIEFINGNIIGAIIILIYSIIFMGFIIDNIFKIIFIKYINKEFSFAYSLSELMVLLSMMAAIGTIGFWGIIVGPSIVALTFASLSIYKDIFINGNIK